MRGRNSVVVSIRVTDSVYTTLEEMADRKGLTVSGFIKSKVTEYARLANVNTTEEYVVIGGQRFRKSSDAD